MSNGDRMQAPQGKRSRVRWLMVFMAFLATAINYIDRANLSVAAPAIQREFALSPSAMGLILGAFFWTYAAFQMPSGWFIDRVGARIAYAAARPFPCRSSQLLSRPLAGAFRL